MERMGASALIEHIQLHEVDGIKSLPTFNIIVGGCWECPKSNAVVFSILEIR